MFKSFKSINDAVMQEIYAYEEQKKLKFEQEFDALCIFCDDPAQRAMDRGYRLK